MPWPWTCGESRVRTGKPFPTQWVESGPEISRTALGVVMGTVAFIPARERGTAGLAV